MSRTDLDATTLANSLRMKAGVGSIEWASEPIQASVLLDAADMLDENARLKQELESVGTAAYLYGRTDLADENAKLREQMERLVTLLRNDCDIEASWDGLRHFWSIELTEDGCLMRDRARKAEAENVKLRELCADMYGFIKRMDEDCGDVTFSDCFDYCKHDTADDGCCKTGECWYEQRMRELGIEVSV